MKIYFQWTPAHVETLKALWDEGLSATHIAARIGGVSRNAVLGKIHRMGLMTHRKSVPSRAPIPPKPKRSTPSLPKVRKAPPVVMLAPLPVVVEEPTGERRGLQVVDLEPHHCRWPLGDPLEPDFHFCGADREHDKTPYCAFHHRESVSAPSATKPPVRGWTPQQKRERKMLVLKGMV